MKSHTKPALRAMPAVQVQISLPVQGVLRDVRHAFLGLCIDAGQKVLAAMMEADRIALCGPKGVPDARRRAVRGGSTASQVVLGGQRIAVRRTRARSTSEGELALPSFQWAACGDPLDAATMAAIAAGVSTRRYASTLEPVPAAHQPRAASKSAVSRRFVQLSQEQLAQWLARPIGELDLPVVMIDGIHFRDRVILLALGIDAKGDKHVLAGLNPLFFGTTSFGVNQPNLTYMLWFDDLAARERNWKAFGSHPDWNKLKVTPGLSDAEIVSNISNIILAPLPFSPIR